MHSLDELDKQILVILGKNARTTAKNISKQVFVSAPTVTARIENLVNEGIIKGYYTEIEPSVFNKNIKAFIDVEAPPAVRDELYEFLRNSPSVIQCSRVTGEYSLIIEAYFKDTSEMDKFSSALQHYGRTKTQIVFSTVIERRAIIHD